MFSWEIYEFFESSHRSCFVKKSVFKTFRNIHRKVPVLQLYLKETPKEMFSSEYCEIFNLLTAALTLLNSYWKAVSSYLCNDSFLSLDNILTGYE